MCIPNTYSISSLIWGQMLLSGKRVITSAVASISAFTFMKAQEVVLLYQMKGCCEG